MAKPTQSIFANETIESPTTVIKETLGVSRDPETGEVVVQFTTNKGKGSGVQVMPVSQFETVIDLLSDYADNGLPEGVSAEENLPADEVIRRTICIDEDGLVSFRSRNGKGAKPARFHIDTLPAIVELLKSTQAAVAKAAAKVK